MTSGRWTTTTLLAGGVMVVYTYVGYPFLIRAAARRHAARATAEPPSIDRLPRFTVLVAAYNEEAVLVDRIEDIRSQDYPAELLHILVVADGSDDRTAGIAKTLGVDVLWTPTRAGKSAAINRGMAVATGEIVCLTDANCFFDQGALRELAASFDGPHVAVVSGAKRVRGHGAIGAGEGLYWRIESMIKEGESVFSCTMGAPGEICAVRRTAFRPLPEGTITDDYHLACDAIRRGLGVRYAPRAIAREASSPSVSAELERRTRVAAGIWQTSFAHLPLALPGQGWTAVAFVSHRLLRSVVVPVTLPILLIAALLGRRHSVIARAALGAQALVYTAGLAGALFNHRWLAVPYQWLLTNYAALRGGIRYVRGTQPSAWRTVRGQA